MTIRFEMDTDTLIGQDIVSWNGVVSRWGAIKEYVISDDLIRMADDNETFHYRRREEKQELIKHRHAIVHHERAIFGISGPYEIFMDMDFKYTGWRNEVKNPIKSKAVSENIQLNFDKRGYGFAFQFETGGRISIWLWYRIEFTVSHSHKFLEMVDDFCQTLDTRMHNSKEMDALNAIWKQKPDEDCMSMNGIEKHWESIIKKHSYGQH